MATDERCSNDQCVPDRVADSESDVIANFAGESRFWPRVTQRQCVRRVVKDGASLPAVNRFQTRMASKSTARQQLQDADFAPKRRWPREY